MFQAGHFVDVQLGGKHRYEGGEDSLFAEKREREKVDIHPNGEVVGAWREIAEGLHKERGGRGLLDAAGKEKASGIPWSNQQGKAASFIRLDASFR